MKDEKRSNRDLVILLVALNAGVLMIFSYMPEDYFKNTFLGFVKIAIPFICSVAIGNYIALYRAASSNDEKHKAKVDELKKGIRKELIKGRVLLARQYISLSSGTKPKTEAEISLLFRFVEGTIGFIYESIHALCVEAQDLGESPVDVFKEELATFKEITVSLNSVIDILPEGKRDELKCHLDKYAKELVPIEAFAKPSKNRSPEAESC